MKARRLELTDYTVTLLNPDVGKPMPNPDAGKCLADGSVGLATIPEPASVDQQFQMKNSLVEILMARDNQLGGRELLERDKLGRRILDSNDGSILLEEADWNRLVRSAETVMGLGRQEVEMVRRIFEAEEVEVEEKEHEVSRG